MKKALLLITLAIGLTLLTSAQTVTLEIYKSNPAKFEQQESRNLLVDYQEEIVHVFPDVPHNDDNNIDIQQANSRGTGNQAAFQDMEGGPLGSIEQIGSRNSIHILQDGAGNRFSGSQRGNENAFDIIQIGDFNYGGSGIHHFIQEGNENYLKLNQTEYKNYSYALTRGNENHVEIMQAAIKDDVSGQNISRLEIEGNQNTLWVEQKGYRNKFGHSSISGQPNVPAIQLGDNNTAKVVQYGLSNSASIHQYENDNSAYIKSEGFSNYFFIYQMNHGNRVNYENKPFGQKGDNNTITINQYSINSMVDIEQHGHYNRSIILQNGESHEADIRMEGIANESIVTQKGDRHNVALEQKGFYNTATINQSGSNHDANIIQNGSGNSAVIIQK